MKIFFLSDTHYFHKNLIRYCNRPFNDEYEMNAEMARRWNSVVSNDDIAIHVGDLSAGLKGRETDLGDLINSLNGRKILVRGNHDHQTNEWYIEKGFERVVENSINLGGVLLMHYPLHEAMKMRLNESAWGTIEHVVHGHTHRTDTPNHDNHFNVAADRLDFTPIDHTSVIPVTLIKNFENALVDWLGK